MTTDDVVVHGREPAGDGPPTWLRVVVLVLAGAVGAFLFSRSGLLSADAPERPEAIGRPTPAAAPGAALVARVENRLVHLGRDEGGARLPDDLPAGTRLVPVLSARGDGTLVGVHDGLLFRVAPEPGARWRPIGQAERVVAASAAPGRAVVLRGDRVVEVEIATGRLAVEQPFPGFDAAAGWQPVDVVSAVGTRALLMRRPAADGAGVELALAWPLRRVEPGTDEPVRALGTVDALLGTAGDWVLGTAGSCPGPDCRVVVVSVTRDRVAARAVGPPPGWLFGVGPSAGRSHETLVTVARVGDPSARALARLVAGGENALLVQDSEGVDLRSGLVAAPDGTVFLVTAAGDERRLRLWDPQRPGRAAPLGTQTGRIPPGATLVCVCGRPGSAVRAMADRDHAVTY